MKCRGTTKSNKPCSNNARHDGYCRVHRPKEIKKKANPIGQKDKYYETLKTIEQTCSAKGWGFYLATSDKKTHRYSTIEVWRGEITG